VRSSSAAIVVAVLLVCGAGNVLLSFVDSGVFTVEQL
jgi:hypothetical protein